ncbi:unnamed protein product [Schistocephalus solidus]|uniref:Uncharacterized protein n=1 Tax=Schistocephalus solidus TaxID=70667 RepID=A0A3P7E5U1_SCHSO|nr:unnamed protein product [Schistocephalus solidus]
MALLTARFGDKKLGNRTELNISPRQPDGDDLRVAKLRRVEQHLSTESTTTTTVGHTLEIRGLQYPTVQLSSKEDEVSTYLCCFSTLLLYLGDLSPVFHWASIGRL